ncbi:MAG: SAM-dependent methyltransferase [Aestuariibacter sp.]
MKYKHVNMSAYDEVECLDNFTESTFDSYCLDKLDSCGKHVHFIQNKVVNQCKDWSGNVCEIGSGNSKLLYALENAKIVSKGVGIEISESRYRFAEKFKQYAGARRVQNICANIFDVELEEKFDVIIGVDIVAQLIAPISDGAQDKLFEWCKRHLKSGGTLLLELWDFEEEQKQLKHCGGRLKQWESFPLPDPFEFCLADISLNDKKDIVWEKLFLKRDGTQRSNFTNVLRPFSRDKIVSILGASGFQKIEVFEFWQREDDTPRGEYIVVAKR